MKTCEKSNLIFEGIHILIRIRSCIPFVILLLVSQTVSLAQSNDDPIDPLLGGYSVGTSDEIVLLWSDFTNTGGGYNHNKV